VLHMGSEPSELEPSSTTTMVWVLPRQAPDEVRVQGLAEACVDDGGVTSARSFRSRAAARQFRVMDP